MKNSNVQISACSAGHLLKKTWSGAVHGDELMRRFAALECVRSGRMRRYGNARVTTGIGDTERAARLEQ